jgi:hypothetical protein
MRSVIVLFKHTDDKWYTGAYDPDEDQTDPVSRENWYTVQLDSKPSTFIAKPVSQLIQIRLPLRSRMDFIQPMDDGTAAEVLIEDGFDESMVPKELIPSFRERSVLLALRAMTHDRVNPDMIKYDLASDSIEFHNTSGVTLRFLIDVEHPLPCKISRIHRTAEITLRVATIQPPEFGEYLPTVVDGRFTLYIQDSVPEIDLFKWVIKSANSLSVTLPKAKQLPMRFVPNAPIDSLELECALLESLRGLSRVSLANLYLSDVGEKSSKPFSFDGLPSDTDFIEFRSVSETKVINFLPIFLVKDLPRVISQHKWSDALEKMLERLRSVPKHKRLPLLRTELVHARVKMIPKEFLSLGS